MGGVGLAVYEWSLKAIVLISLEVKIILTSECLEILEFNY